MFVIHKIPRLTYNYLKMKQNIRYPLLLALATITLTSLHSQEPTQHNKEKKIADNWYIGISGGAQIYMSEGDTKGEFKDRITPAMNIEVGKWFLPYLGLRAVAGGINLKTTQLDDPTQFKEWDYFQVRMDVQFNLINAINHNPQRIYEPILYAGFGIVNGREVNFLPTNQMGLINNFRLSRHIDLNLEASIAMVPEDWDNKVGKKSIDGIFAITAGLSVKFPKRYIPKQDPRANEELSRLNQEINQLLTSLEQCNAELEEMAEPSSESAEPEEEEFPEEEVIIQSPLSVQFDTNSSLIGDDQLETIARMADTIRSNPNTSYQIIGYADIETGSSDYNLWLSERRARNVANMLIQRHGISPSRIQAIAKGSSEQPYDDGISNRVAILLERD